MSDRRLQVFNTVARLLSFTKAAEVLHMTQPAVTFQVRQLEEAFNTRLFDRAHNRISLTAAGNQIYHYSDRIFELYSEMENSVKEITGEISGSVVIGASTTVAEYLLPALLGKFKAEHNDVKIVLNVSNSDGIIQMVENNSIDLGVIEAPVHNQHLKIEACMDDQLEVMLTPDHPLAKKRVIKIDDLMDVPFICREEGSGTREVISDYFQEHNYNLEQLEICFELGSPEAVKGAIEAGMGVSILSKVTITKELELGTLCSIPLAPPLIRPFSFIRQRQKFRHSVIEKLLDFARDYCKTKQYQKNG